MGVCHIFSFALLNSRLPYTFPAGFGVGPRLRSNESPSGAFKRQRGLRQQMEGRCPDKHAQQEHFGNSQELEKRSPGWPCSARGQEPSTSVGGSFCFAGALRDGVVYSAWFNNSEFIKENIDETIFMFALFKCRKSDKGRN